MYLETCSYSERHHMVNDDQAGRLGGMGRAELEALKKTQDTKRRDAEARLGAALYPLTKDDSKFTANNQGLYDELTKLYQSDKAMEERLAQIEREEEEARRKAEEEARRAAEARASKSYECPNCHAILEPGDKYCTGCGMPRAQVIAGQKTPSASTCPNCGAEVNPGEKFCFNCGRKLV